MTPRSWLFVPGDSDKKLAKAPETGAHAIIVDLEDSVAFAAKPEARGTARAWLETHRPQVVARRQARWVRINAIDTGLWREDLNAVMSGAPDGIGEAAESAAASAGDGDLRKTAATPPTSPRISPNATSVAP